jgi:uncharacterized membrane protein HdeD (DUF308 family)
MSTATPDAAALARFRGLFLALGTALILLGLAAFVYSCVFTIIAVEIIGTFLLVGGLLQAGQAGYAPSRGAAFWALALGTLTALAGLIIVFHPLIGAGYVTLLLGSYFLVGGAFRVVLSFIDSTYPKPWPILAGLIDLLLGGLILAKWPGDSLWVVGTFVAVNLLFSGVMWWALALSLRAPTAPAASA